ncbi:MAG: hypothetical protein JSS64_06885 [Bacteroidetes bacterium]|nr:hypothetical protein [Bacteroidota bacterium]
MENKLDNLFIIGYGLAGGFGGANNFLVIEARDFEDAEQQAYEMACEEYENYAGMNGLRDITQIMEEDEIESEDEAQEVFNDERESWLDYSAVKYSKEEEKKVENHNYQNDYTELTN